MSLGFYGSLLACAINMLPSDKDFMTANLYTNKEARH